jgi:hypothetical protein
MKSLGTKEKYKTRPRHIPEKQITTTKKPTLNDYWLNQPSPSHTNKFSVLIDEGTEEAQMPTPQTTP